MTDPDDSCTEHLDTSVIQDITDGGSEKRWLSRYSSTWRRIYQAAAVLEAE